MGFFNDHVLGGLKGLFYAAANHLDTTRQDKKYWTVDDCEDMMLRYCENHPEGNLYCTPRAGFDPDLAAAATVGRDANGHRVSHNGKETFHKAASKIT